MLHRLSFSNAGRGKEETEPLGIGRHIRRVRPVGFSTGGIGKRVIEYEIHPVRDALRLTVIDRVASVPAIRGEWEDTKARQPRALVV
jgi:hypothetical protein